MPRRDGEGRTSQPSHVKSEAEALFDEVAALPMNGRRRLYTADLRRRVLAFIEKRIAEGGSECKASAELGIHQATITGWRGGKKRSPKKRHRATKVRAVEVVATTRESTGPVLLFGSGARIEGLSTVDIIALVKGVE